MAPIAASSRNKVGGEAVVHAGTYDRRPRPLTYAPSADKVQLGARRGHRIESRLSLLGQESGG